LQVPDRRILGMSHLNSPAGELPADTARHDVSPGRTMLNKVPEVVLLFWVVKVLSTTVGETGADYLADNVGLGLTTTSFIMAGLLAAVLVVQFRVRRYVPVVYWLAVVLVSVVGTLISDNLVDNFGVSLWTTTAVFAAGLAATFTLWYRSERTLSIHTIVTTRRESFYWLAILFTFALGTSAGDLISEQLGWGYLTALLIFGGVIVVLALAYWRGLLGEVLAFWAVYVLTRPLGASLGDLLTAPKADGGLGLGTNAVSTVFLVVILAAVGWFTVQDRRALRPVGAL
jgi:uncharacterized membrane-anchored protein